jgi:hypothetical protein
VIASNPVLTSYSHGAKQIMRAVDNNKTAIKLTENQAKTFCQSFTNKNFAYHTIPDNTPNYLIYTGAYKRKIVKACT